MFKNYKLLKTYELEEKQRKHAIIEDAKDGQSEISLRLPAEEPIISPYSSLNNPVLYEDLDDYLMESTQKIPVKLRLTIRIESPTDEEKKALFQSALVSHCNHRLSTLAMEKLRTNNKTLFCSIIGFLILILVFTLSFIEKNNVLFESISIIAWVFLWEATDLFVFERGRIQREEINYHRLKNATIVIDDKSATAA